MRQRSPSGHSCGGGMSPGSPRGAPLSTQRAMVAICSSLKEMSLTNSWMPTVLSICHGGISRATTLLLIDRAHGRTSSYVTSGIGAIWPTRWQPSHFCCRIGAMSRVNVGSSSAGAAPAAAPAGRSTADAAPASRRDPESRFQQSCCSRFSGYFDQHVDIAVGPAALEPDRHRREPLRPRIVPRQDAQDVFAGRVEPGGRDRLAAPRPAPARAR